MIRYVIQTQLLENYGAHCEDGKHINGNASWRFKSGSDYIVTGLDRIQDAVAFVQASLVEHGNTLGYKEFPIEWMTFDEWEASLTELEPDYQEFLRKIAKRLDPRGQDVIELMDQKQLEK